MFGYAKHWVSVSHRMTAHGRNLRPCLRMTFRSEARHIIDAKPRPTKLTASEVLNSGALAMRAYVRHLSGWPSFVLRTRSIIGVALGLCSFAHAIASACVGRTALARSDPASNRVIALLAAFNEQLIFIHLTTPYFASPKRQPHIYGRPPVPLKWHGRNFTPAQNS
jgi:hypothetical protein